MVGGFDLERALVQDFQAQVVEVGQDLAQALGLQHVELDAGVLFQRRAGAFGEVDVDAGMFLGGFPGPLGGGTVLLEAGDVLQGILHLIVDAVARREGLRPHGGELLGAVFLDASGAVGAGMQDLGDAFAPRARRADQPLFEIIGVDVADIGVLRKPDPEEEPRQGGFRHPRLVVDGHGVERLAQFLLDAQAHVGGVPVARKVDEGGHKAAVDVRPQEQPGPAAFLQPLDARGNGGQVGDFDLEELVAGVGFEDAQQVLAGVRIGREAGVPQDCGDLLPDHRDVTHGSGVGGGGEESDEAAFAVDVAGRIEALDADVVEVGGAVDGGAGVGLGDDERALFARLLPAGLGEVLDLVRGVGTCRAAVPRPLSSRGSRTSSPDSFLRSYSR